MKGPDPVPPILCTRRYSTLVTSATSMSLSMEITGRKDFDQLRVDRNGCDQWLEMRNWLANESMTALPRVLGSLGFIVSTATATSMYIPAQEQQKPPIHDSPICADPEYCNEH